MGGSAGIHLAGTPQVVGYQEVPVYEQVVHREVPVPYEVEVPVPYEVERLVEVPYEVEVPVEVPVEVEVPVYLEKRRYGEPAYELQVPPAVRDIFARFDRHSGRLDYQELRSVLRDLQIDVASDEGSVLAIYDADGPGLMELDEFAWVASYLAYVDRGNAFDVHSIGNLYLRAVLRFELWYFVLFAAICSHKL